jgi:hypothetical protein
VQIVPTRPMTPSLADAMDRPNRLAVQRSPAYELLTLNTETEQTTAAVRKLLDQEGVGRVVSALRSTNMELTLPGELECGQIIVALTRFMRITAGNWTQAQRQDWQAGVMEELATAPYLLVADALEEARRKVEFPQKLVVWVFQEIGPKIARLERERATYQRLLEIADARPS